MLVIHLNFRLAKSIYFHFAFACPLIHHLISMALKFSLHELVETVQWTDDSHNNS